MSASDMLFSEDLAEKTNWTCSGLSIVILVIRGILSFGTPQFSKIDQGLCILSISVLATRIPLVYYSLFYGKIRDEIKTQGSASGSDMAKLKKAVIITLVTRFLVTTYYWLQNALLLRFYSRCVGHVVWVHKTVVCCWMFLLSAYIASVLTIFLECHPFNLYWDLIPTADKCTRAYAQIFTQGVFNISLDLLLLVIAVPMLFWTHFSIAQVLRILVLVVLGTFCIIVTAVKLFYVVGENSSQSTRSFWAAVQVLVSTFVANAPTIYGSLRLKIARAREHSTDAALTRAQTRAESVVCDSTSHGVEIRGFSNNELTHIISHGEDEVKAKIVHIE